MIFGYIDYVITGDSFTKLFRRIMSDKLPVSKMCEKNGKLTVLQVGSISKGLGGKELSDLKGLIDAGCRVFSEDGKSVMNSALMRQAM